MERKEFIQLLTLGTPLFLAGCLDACAAGLPALGAARVPASHLPDDPIMDVRINLDDPVYAPLHDPKQGFIYLAEGRVIVAKTTEDIYLAVAATCPHLGEQLRYQRRQNHFECPSHGSSFNDDGTLAEGPSRRGVRSYRVTRTEGELHIEG